jgi:hypothetical protein
MGSGGFAGQYAYGLYLADSDGKNERVLHAGKGPNYNPSVAQGMTLVTNNLKHFSSVSDLKVEVWSRPLGTAAPTTSGESDFVTWACHPA